MKSILAEYKVEQRKIGEKAFDYCENFLNDISIELNDSLKKYKNNVNSNISKIFEGIKQKIDKFMNNIQQSLNQFKDESDKMKLVLKEKYKKEFYEDSFKKDFEQGTKDIDKELVLEQKIRRDNAEKLMKEIFNKLKPYIKK